MDLDRHDEHKQHTFDSFCKKVIRCEAYNAYRAIGRRQDLEIPFSQLPEEAMEALAAWDVYPWEYTSFPVDGDGGCNVCGGMGPLLGYLPCSPHCKPEVREDNEIHNDYDFFRPVIRVQTSGWRIVSPENER